VLDGKQLYFVSDYVVTTDFFSIFFIQVIKYLIPYRADKFVPN